MFGRDYYARRYRTDQSLPRDQTSSENKHLALSELVAIHQELGGGAGDILEAGTFGKPESWRPDAPAFLRTSRPSDVVPEIVEAMRDEKPAETPDPICFDLCEPYQKQCVSESINPTTIFMFNTDTCVDITRMIWHLSAWLKGDPARRAFSLNTYLPDTVFMRNFMTTKYPNKVYFLGETCRPLDDVLLVDSETIRRQLLFQASREEQVEALRDGGQGSMIYDLSAKAGLQERWQAMLFDGEGGEIVSLTDSIFSAFFAVDQVWVKLLKNLSHLSKLFVFRLDDAGHFTERRLFSNYYDILYSYFSKILFYTLIQSLARSAGIHCSVYGCPGMEVYYYSHLGELKNRFKKMMSFEQRMVKNILDTIDQVLDKFGEIKSDFFNRRFFDVFGIELDEILSSREKFYSMIFPAPLMALVTAFKEQGEAWAPRIRQQSALFRAAYGAPIPIRWDNEGGGEGFFSPRLGSSQPK